MERRDPMIPWIVGTLQRGRGRSEAVTYVEEVAMPGTVRMARKEHVRGRRARRAAKATPNRSSLDHAGRIGSPLAVPQNGRLVSGQSLTGPSFFAEDQELAASVLRWALTSVGERSPNGHDDQCLCGISEGRGKVTG